MVYKTILLILFSITVNAQIMLNPNRAEVIDPPAGGGGNLYITDNLELLFDDDDYTSGTWTDQINSYVITDAGSPTKTAGGIVFTQDGFVNQTEYLLSVPLTLYFVVEIVSDGSGSENMFNWYDSPNTINIYWSGGTFFAHANDGAGVDVSNATMDDSLAIMGLLTMSFDGDTVKVYSNGTLDGTGTTSLGGNDLDTEAFAFCGVEAAFDFLDNNSIVRLILYYDVEHTPAEVLQNWQSDLVQDKL